jgi:hypothetical protein
MSQPAALPGIDVCHSRAPDADRDAFRRPWPFRQA